jgi:hypothetical protein
MSNTVLAPKPTSTKPQVKEQASPKKGFQGFDIYGWLVDPSRFTPVAFFIGIALAFGLCSFAGRTVSKHNIYENFKRFHDYISPASLYYPTISQMVSIVNANSKPDQTIVIVGGNSVSFGLGQNEDQLWSDRLQKQLGPKYAVFNFANPSSDPFEWGYWTAEALLKKQRKVLYVTITMPGNVGKPEGEDVYGYGFWDAREKHLLIKDKFRDARVTADLKELNEKDQVKMAELQLRSKFDSLLYFEDLWTAVSYSDFFTVWTHLTSATPLSAHKQYTEIKCYPGPVEGRFKSDYDLNSIRSYARSYFDIQSAKPREALWYKIVSDMFTLIPQQYKKNCLVVVSTHTPAYIDRLTDIEKERETICTQKSVASWRQAGYHSFTLKGQVDKEDFLDARHLIDSGGKKLATLVAAELQKMNKELKY